jgi:predicted permease
MWETLWQDLRYGLRLLAKNPGFTAVAVLTLALGIGANTAIFSVVDSVLLRPLPFKQSEQLVVLFTKDSHAARNWVSYPDFQDWRQQSKNFDAIAAWVPQSVNLTGQGEPKRVVGAFVSANFLPMLGVEPVTGRNFREGEDHPGDHVAIISYGMWQGMLGGDPNLLGKSLALNGEPFTVIGITPQNFHFPLSDPQVLIPYPYYPNFSQQRDRISFAAIGRIKSGVNMAQAQSEMNTISGRLAIQYPATNADRTISLVPFHGVAVENVRPQILLLWAMVGLVLLIACANVANLLLARATGRSREMALRATLGARRSRIIRQLLTETTLLWLTGGVAGVLWSYWGVAALATRLDPDLARGLHVNGTALAFTLLISVLTGLLFGLGPALGLSKINLSESLKQSSGALTPAHGGWMRRVLVVMQVAMALLLLTGSGLLLRSLQRVLHVSPGFDSSNLLTMEYRLPRNKYSKDYQPWNFHREVVQRVSALPGVKSASVVLALPFSGNGNVTPLELLDRPAPAPGHEPATQANLSDSNLLRTLGIPLLRGRFFTEQDTADQPTVAVINETMARRFWPDGDLLEKQIRIPQQKITARIVGVVGDVRQFSLEDPDQSQVYVPFAQQPFIFATLAVKTQGDPLALTKSVQQAVWSVDPDQPMWKIRTLESLVDRSLGQRRLTGSLLAGFAVLVLLLAALGIYGVMAYAVSQRTHEIGIRMALGAQPENVLKLVIWLGSRLVICGIAFGLASAFALVKLMTALLFGVSPFDPFTFASVAILLSAVALAACYIPARRAMRVDPLLALRYE